MSDQALRDENAPEEPADGGVAADAPPTVAALEERVAELEQAQARALADYRNLERRTAEGRAELRRLTTASVIINLLPVYDDLTRAIDAVEDDIAEHDWVEGIKLIREKFRGVLDATGAAEIEALGKAFDPRLHEAMGYAAGPEGQVVHVMQSGWAIDEQVVRPAKVMVGNGDGAAPTTDMDETR
jgi:molecular chaperone GrpE